MRTSPLKASFKLQVGVRIAPPYSVLLLMICICCCCCCNKDIQFNGVRVSRRTTVHGCDDIMRYLWYHAIFLTVIWLLPTFYAARLATSRPQSGTVYRYTLDHSLQHQLPQLSLSILNLTFLLWHTPCDHVIITAHTIRLVEIDTVRYQFVYLLTYLSWTPVSNWSLSGLI